MTEILMKQLTNKYEKLNNLETDFLFIFSHFFLSAYLIVSYVLIFSYVFLCSYDFMFIFAGHAKK